MKKIPIIAILLFLASGFYMCGQKTKASEGGGSTIEFDTISHNFGEIPYTGNGEFEFIFTNTGKEPLIVTHVKSTCGCTVPEWSREPVNSGESGSVRVSYDTHRVGAFAKSIYVYSNADNGVKRLMISGKVISADI